MGSRAELLWEKVFIDFIDETMKQLRNHIYTRLPSQRMNSYGRDKLAKYNATMYIITSVVKAK